MKAALIREVGSLPAVADRRARRRRDRRRRGADQPHRPRGLAWRARDGHAAPPYVPGCEAVGRTADGRTVWVFGGGFGRTLDGGIAERAAIGDATAIDVPEGADPAVAAGLGIAGLAGWLPFARRAAAGRRGRARARRDGVGRSRRGAGGEAARRPPRRGSRQERGGPRARCLARRGRDRAARRGRRPRRGLQGRVRRQRPELRVRPALGAPAAAAAQAAVPWATIVNLGQSAGRPRSSPRRPSGSRASRSSGTRTTPCPRTSLAEHYRRLVGHVMSGEIAFEVERVPLTRSPPRGSARPTARARSSSSCPDAARARPIRFAPTPSVPSQTPPTRGRTR